MIMSFVKIDFFVFNLLDFFCCFEFRRMCVIMIVYSNELVIVVNIIVKQNATVYNPKYNEAIKYDSNDHETQQIEQK